MTQPSSAQGPTVARVAVAALLAALAAPAFAQVESAQPLPNAPPPGVAASSTLAGNSASASEQRESRTLAAAVFAKPSAAARAADKASTAVQPDLSAVQPKESWVNGGPHIHKKGVRITTPF